MAEVNITVSGNVGNDPALRKSKTDLSWTQFSVYSTRRVKDQESGIWVDGTTLRFTVRAWGSRAENIIDSIRKGTPVIVTGRLSEEPYVVNKLGEHGEPIIEHKSGLVIENAVVAVDLSRGVAKYFRTEREQTEAIPTWLPGTPVSENTSSAEIAVIAGWDDNVVPDLADDLVAA